MQAMTFGSVCSGIEAASVAWHPLGWRADWLAEIEPFPSAVLAHRFPDVPNLGDMTAIASRVRAGEVPAPAILVGGTPCQAFSVAGLRGGLSDPRGALTIAYVDLANAIDHVRLSRGEQPAAIVWENVPGVLSSKDNAFGCFLAGLAGESSELQPPGGKWSDAGCVFGPQRAIAWRTLDAQYFGVAQRRRRVFVVASARDRFDPGTVLFEFDGVRRDTAPSREAGEGIAGTLEASAGRSRGAGTPPGILTTAGTLRSSDGGADVDHARAGHLIGSWWDGGQVSQTLDAVLHKGQTMPEKNRFPAVLQPAYSTSGDGYWRPGFGPLRAREQDSHESLIAFHGSQDPCVSGDITHPLGRNNGAEGCFAYGAAMRVRRITPREGERLQGFPDDWTLVPVKGKPAADGPRYKAIGNSMAIPVVRWLGIRIMSALEGKDCGSNTGVLKTPILVNSGD